MVLLPGAGGSDQRDLLADARAARDVADHRRAGLVLEGHVVELEGQLGVSSGSAPSRVSSGLCGRVFVLVVEELEDALGAGHRDLEERVAGRQVADGDEERLDVSDEREEGAEGDRVLGPAPERAHARVPEHRGDADAGDHLDGRVERGVVDDGAVVGVAVGVVDLVELGGALLLAGVGLHHGHARDLLVQVGVHPRGLGADLAEGVADAAARPVDAQGHGRDARRRRGATSSSPSTSMMETMATRRTRSPKRVERARAEHLVDGVDVVGDAGDEPADRRAIEEAQLAGVEEVEDVGAQLGHGARAADLHQVHLREGDRLLDDQHREDREAVAGERRARRRRTDRARRASPAGAPWRCRR